MGSPDNWSQRQDAAKTMLSAGPPLTTRYDLAQNVGNAKTKKP